MPDDPRVRQLLHELLASDATPEQVCGSCAELLPVVRERWRQVVRTRADLDALFPPEAETPLELADTLSERDQYPVVPGYDIEAVLGAGGMGVVFKARHLRLNRSVALKMALAGAYAGPRERERFQREAEAIASLRHPNVVQVHDVGEAAGKPYLTMEFVDGGSLAEKLAGTPLPVRDAAALVASLAAAVHAAHAAGIVHRDLKPGNVLLTADGTPKIGDFGLARRLGGDAGLTRTGTALGTASYMAPEQAQGKADAAGPPADVYALGAILYETLTGRPPFRAESAAETVHQLLTQDPVSPSRLNGKVPRDLETICLKCLAKASCHRYPNAATLEEDLRRFLRGDPILARPEGRTRRVVRAVRRRPTLAVGAVAAVTLATLALAGGSWLLADRAAVDRAVAGDLGEIDDHLQKSSFIGARAAIERAHGRVGGRESPALRQQLNLRQRDCELAERLDMINLAAADILDGMSSIERADKGYDEAFGEFGLGRYGDDLEAVAARVRESRIRRTVLAALDRWSAVARTKNRQEWILRVANAAEPDPTPWRADARNPALRRDGPALFALLERADVGREQVALLLAVNHSLRLQDSARQIPFLKMVHRAYPDDLWVNIYLGYALLIGKQPEEAVRYFQAVVALRPKLAIGYYSLGTALYSLGGRAPGHYDDAVVQLRKALEIEPNSGIANFTLLDTLAAAGRYDEVITQAGTALRYDHQVARVRAVLGLSLRATGRVEEGFEQFRLAFELEPENQFVQDEFRAALLQERRWDELRPLWHKVLEGDRPQHSDWYGYAELCLYLGREEEYHRARTALLTRFGTTDSPQTAERVARAGLLLPASGEELKKAVSLAELAGLADPKQAGVLYPYYQFVRGFAEYRQGNYERAIAVLRGEAARMAGPLPPLVLAMALHQTGKEAEARRTFASAMTGHDWRGGVGGMPDGWIRHVLRREAERLMVPDLAALLSGERQPRDNDERLALIGVCRFENRFATLSRIYAVTFAADPKRADGQRFAAARVAVQAGCRRGVDVMGLSESERGKWRTQARAWLLEELSVLAAALDRDFSKHSDRVRRTLTNWQTEPELADIRDPAGLEKLSPDERAECRNLWTHLSAVLASTSVTK